MANTTLIGLTLPVTGTLSGTWGDTVNNAISQIVDVAVAGTQTISADADITLTLTTGSSASTGLTANSSQYAVILWTASGTATRTITVPATSKTYVVINKTGSTQSIIVIGATGTGVTIVAGEKAVVVFDGTNYVKVATSLGTGSVTSVAATVPSIFSISGSPITTSGTLAMTYSGTALPAANGGTGVANNAASTITISGSYATTLTLTGTTSVTLPTSGTLTTTGKAIAMAMIFGF